MTDKELLMSKRLRYELWRIGDGSPTRIANMLDCDRQLVFAWLSLSRLPCLRYFQALCEIGCDAMYILTGERSRDV